MTKLVTISDYAYTELESLKKEGESFSDLVMRLIKKWGKDYKDAKQ